jgi:hypothetical protein
LTATLNKGEDSISPTTSEKNNLACKKNARYRLIDSRSQYTLGTPSIKQDSMKHLIVVGACYLDTILKNVTVNYTSMASTDLPSVYLFSRLKTQSYVPPVSISDVEVTVRIRFKSWNSYSQSMMVSSCI